MTIPVMRRFTPALLIAAACSCGAVGRPAAVAPAAVAPAAPSGPPAVVLVSLDGFRWDYLDRPVTPNLQRLARAGVRAERMVPSFPSLTFPNHYTIVTGLYPEHHGIISNTIVDPALGTFRLSDTNAVRNAAWWGGEPLWVTAEKQSRHAGAFFWPGSEAPIEGIRASRVMTFDDRFPNAARVDSVLTWLTLPGGQAMSLVTLYYSDVDHAGHTSGPMSREVDVAIARVDSMIGRLRDGIAARGLSNRVNLIVVADHGMTGITPERVIFLDDYISLDAVDIVELSSIGALTPKPGKLAEVYDKLRNANRHLAAYRKGEVPARLHYNTNARITPLVLIADEGWTITTHARFAARKPTGGSHGYDNEVLAMGALFVAEGPAFRQRFTMPPFQNIHIYDLICHILGLTPAPNDGSLDSTRAMLRQP